MSRPDPLDFFKEAESEPRESRVRAIIKKKLIGQTKGDKESSDTGEAALAGLSVSSMAAVKAGPRLLRLGIKKKIPSGGPLWPAHSPGEFSTIEQTLKEMEPRWFEVPAGSKMPPPKTKNLLGLFPISERPVIRGKKNFQNAVAQMESMQPVVDSFIKKHDLAAKGVKIQFKGGVPAMLQGPHYHTFTKRVRLSRVDPASALHELGHAADYNKDIVGKARAILGPRLRGATMLSLPIAYIAGDEIKKALPGTVDDKTIEFMQQNAPSILGATLAATTLYPEAKASYLALQHVKETQGPKAARAMAKTLIPKWGSYALATIPAMIGISFAKKYYNEAKKRGEDLEKESGIIQAIPHMFRDVRASARHVGRQIAEGARELRDAPDRMQRIQRAAKEVGTDPAFIYGALSVGIPATMATAYMYGTKHGPIVKDRLEAISPKTQRKMLSTGPIANRLKDRVPDDWKTRNPGLYAGLVGTGAAMSAGIMTKLFYDLLHAF